MIRTLVALMLLVAITAEECDLGAGGGLVNKPGTIIVDNVSTDQTAVVAVIAQDVRSYPTLAAGQTAEVQTNVGGPYQVLVVMTPENTSAYRDELRSLRRLVEKQVDGATDPAEKTQLFIDLAGIKAAIQALEDGNAAGCSGRLTLSTDHEEVVAATVRWSTTSGGGFWSVTCGST